MKKTVLAFILSLPITVIAEVTADDIAQCQAGISAQVHSDLFVSDIQKSNSDFQRTGYRTGAKDSKLYQFQIDDISAADRANSVTIRTSGFNQRPLKYCYKCHDLGGNLQCLETNNLMECRNNSDSPFAIVDSKNIGPAQLDTLNVYHRLMTETLKPQNVNNAKDAAALYQQIVSINMACANLFLEYRGTHPGGQVGALFNVLGQEVTAAKAYLHSKYNVGPTSGGSNAQVGTSGTRQ